MHCLRSKFETFRNTNIKQYKKAGLSFSVEGMKVESGDAKKTPLLLHQNLPKGVYRPVDLKAERQYEYYRFASDISTLIGELYIKPYLRNHPEFDDKYAISGTRTINFYIQQQGIADGIEHHTDKWNRMSITTVKMGRC